MKKLILQVAGLAFASFVKEKQIRAERGVAVVELFI